MNSTKKIVSFDGTSPSGGFGYIGAGVLARMQEVVNKQSPGLGILDGVEAFAGTSAGSWTALYLAAQEDPSAGLSGILDYWQQLVEIMSRTISLCGGVEALTGSGALLDSKPLRSFFSEYFGARTTLGDLHHDVMITSFQLDSPDEEPRCWRAKVFDSGDPYGHDKDELVVDVALRSSSPPVLDPIYQSLKKTGPGYIDGGVFANDPSLLAYTRLLHRRRLGFASFDEVLVFSLGNGVVPKFIAPRFRDGVADWGYSRWLLDPRKPLVAIDLMIEAGMTVTQFQAEQILEDAYHRIDPALGDVSVISPSVSKAVTKILGEASTWAQVAEGLEWLTTSGWYGDADQVQQPDLPGPPEPQPEPQPQEEDA